MNQILSKRFLTKYFALLLSETFNIDNWFNRTLRYGKKPEYIEIFYRILKKNLTNSGNLKKHREIHKDSENWSKRKKQVFMNEFIRMKKSFTEGATGAISSTNANTEEAASEFDSEDEYLQLYLRLIGTNSSRTSRCGIPKQRDANQFYIR